MFLVIFSKITKKLIRLACPLLRSPSTLPCHETSKEPPKPVPKKSSGFERRAENWEQKKAGHGRRNIRLLQSHTPWLSQRAAVGVAWAVIRYRHGIEVDGEAPVAEFLSLPR